MQKVNLLKYHDIGRDSFNNKKHCHDSELEILHVISGDGVMMIKDKLYPLSPNTAFFISGKDAHCSAPQTPASYVRNKAVFSENLLKDIADTLGCTDIIKKLFSNGGCAVKLSADASIKTDGHFFKMQEAEKTGKETKVIRFFINIFSIMDIAIQYRDKNLDCIKNKISDVIEYINKNADKNLSLAVIIKDMNISKYYLCHLFRETVGMTVFEYIRYIRISRAKQLLTETEHSISEIAATVGFDSFAYFSKVFREYEDVTPGQYRKQKLIRK